MKNFMQNIRHNAVNLIEERNNSTKSLIPIKDRNIATRLQGSININSIYDYIGLLPRMHTILMLYNYFENKMIRTHNMNPHKDYFPLKYFIKPTKVWELYDSILNNINYPAFQKFIHIGEKGSGKTITQNCWLHKNHKKLEENKVFWIRCDVHKLYQLYQRTSLTPKANITPPVTIEEYLKVQFIYVFAKYIDKSDLFKEIYNKIKVEGPKYTRRANRKNILNTETIPIEKGVEDIINSIKVEKGKPTNYSHAMYMLKQAMLPTNITQFAFEQWLYLSDALQRYLLDNGYKILKIVDGLDNIEFLNNNGLEYYKMLLDTVADFVFTKPEPGVFRLTSMRGSSLNDLKRVHVHATDPIGYDMHYLTINHTTPKLKDITTQRANLFFTELNQELTEKEIRTKEHQEYIKILKEVFLNQDTLYENNDFFNNNMRALLHSKLSLTLQMLFRYLQKGAGIINNRIEYDYQILFRRNLFLNGYLYLDTKSLGLKTIKQGSILYNIFYFNNDSSKTVGKWTGLCSIRIMQYLRRSNGATTKNTCKILQTSFSYKKSYIKKCISILWTYGFIESYTNTNVNRIYYRITTKGEMALTYILSDFDTLYYFSLDTPICSHFVKKGFIQSHRNHILINKNTQENIPISSDYPSASIISTISFILFIHLVNDEEQKKLSDDNKRIFKDPFNAKAKKQIYQRIRYLYNTANEEEKKVINNYFSAIGLSTQQVEEVKQDLLFKHLHRN